MSVYVIGEQNESHSEHSITFCPLNVENMNKGFNTWKDWHMVPRLMQSNTPKKIRTEYITVPGRDGVLDYTEANGKVFADNNTGSWEFIVLHEFHPDKSWAEVYSEILNNLHGKKVKYSFLDAPEYYYVGRIFVNQWKSDPHWSTITLDYDRNPGRTKITTVANRPKG